MTVTMMYIVLRRSKDTIKMSKYEKYARALRMTTQNTKFYLVVGYLSFFSLPHFSKVFHPFIIGFLLRESKVFQQKTSNLARKINSLLLREFAFKH